MSFSLQSPPPNPEGEGRCLVAALPTSADIHAAIQPLTTVSGVVL